MPNRFTTGSSELDSLLEELRAGDNVVFYADAEQDYLPFVIALREHLLTSLDNLIYVRTSGLLDQVLGALPRVQVIDAQTLAVGGDVFLSLEQEARRIGPYAYYIFEPLSSWIPWIGNQEALGRFFLTLCPLLYQLQSIAYWALIQGRYKPNILARIKDCTQVFIRLERRDGDGLLLTLVKALGRYSEAMFRPHRVVIEGTNITVRPLPIDAASRDDYVRALADKSRELAEIRNALDRSNRALQSRNEELATLNRQLAEQSRLYRSLRVNLDHLLALFRAGREIGATLMVDQVRQATVRAALRVFRASGACLRLTRAGSEPVIVEEGDLLPYEELPEARDLSVLRDQVCLEGRVHSLRLSNGGSLAVAPIIIRGRCWGTLEVYAPDHRLDDDDARTLLGFLISEASIALDNAHLYHETQIQGEQLRSFIEDTIVSEEQQSRRLAFDLHDGLVQMIVASFQHLQTAQAWRHRDPSVEEREIGQGIRLLREAIYEARRLIAQLRPAGLDDFGLPHALRLFATRLSEEADWRVTVEVEPGWPKLPAELETALYRIVQEATNNARKYAQADRVAIHLSATADELCVVVRDWGKGFDPQKVPDRTDYCAGIGLVGIQERARHWGGVCHIDSQPGQGTTIRVCIPRTRALETTGDD
ncbi:MAG: GAF domain-containing sensor histidine kinase [Chloroflexi bacterium]|nr:GAF domain-containing sensor histidine kinase [Chloroflexota bacterium]